MASGKRPGKGENRVLASFLSYADMTTNQYSLVQIFASDTVGTLTQTANTVGTYHIGIQENLPMSGAGAEISVCMHGVTLGIAGEVITAGQLLIPHTNSGYVFAATNTVGTGVVSVIGRAMRSASAAGEVIPIFVFQSPNALQ